jgi:hypothetical protein
MITLWLHRIIGGLGGGVLEALSIISPLMNLAFAVSYWTRGADLFEIAPHATLITGVHGKGFKFIRSA